VAGGARAAGGAEAAAAAADELARRIEAPGAQVLGPAPLFALRGRARSQIVIKAADRRAAIEGVGAAVDGFARERRAPKGVSVSVDVDPQ
jgi:primosomal protein N' (replication factor Y)